MSEQCIKWKCLWMCLTFYLYGENGEKKISEINRTAYDYVADEPQFIKNCSLNEPFIFHILKIHCKFCSAKLRDSY